jgi:hypothetical protein
MLQFDVRADIREATKFLTDVQRQVIPAATARALDRTASNAKTVAVKTIVTETGLPTSLVRDRLTIRGANRNRLEATLTANPAAPNLIRFNARQTKQGVSANAWRKRRVYPGTFIANQGRTVFKRVGKNRLPIKPIHGPSVPRTFIQREAQRAIEAIIAGRFVVNFESAIAGLLKRRGLS